MNKVTLHGRLAKDVEMRRTQSGKSVASFTIAVDGVGQNAKAEFIGCIAWEKTAENIGKFFSKGKEILAEGRLQTRSYESNGTKKYVTEVVVTNFEFCGSKLQNGHSEAEGSKGTNNTPDLFGGTVVANADDMEIPF